MPSQPSPLNAARCSVIVLNCNGRELLRACLDSLVQQTNSSFETIVVDNGSTDGSLEMLAHNYPHVRAIPLPENHGFSIANNVAMKDAIGRGAEFVLLLNNDTVVAPSLIDELVAVIQTDTNIAAVCPKIYFADQPGLFWYAGADFSLSTARLVQHGWKQPDTGQFDHRQEVAVVTGCAVLVRSSVMLEVGFLDESLWAYLEDLEWSIRFRQHGYRLRMAPRAVVWHKDGATWVRMLANGSQAKRQYYSTRNLVLIGWKHARWWQVPTYALGVLINELAFYTALRIWRRDFRALWAIYRGAAAGLMYVVSKPTRPKRVVPMQDCG